ncbi:MAG: nuclear transport factor 2 family protein [Myxococcales bacterium]|nr:nuclear transport factor 2 family protein [Myxococcales bacterium]
MVRWFAVVSLILIACGSSKSSEPQRGSAEAVAPAPQVVDDAAVKAELVRRGDAWRKDPKDLASLTKVLELARTHGRWRDALPYMTASFATTDLALDAAFEAVAVHGTKDPTFTIAMLTPLVTPTPGQRSIPYDKLTAASRHAGAAIVPAYLAVARLDNHPALRYLAFRQLGDLGVTEVRPLLFAQLAEAPVVVRDANGGFTDPRTRLPSAAISALRKFGFDTASADAVFEFAFDKRAWSGDRYSAIETFAKIAPAPSPEQLQKLLDHAIHYKQYDDGEQCGRAYAMLVGTVAELEALAAAPKNDPPYGANFTQLIAMDRRELACEHKPVCLVTLLETLATRQYDPDMLEKVMRELALRPDPAVRGALLALLDHLDDGDRMPQFLEWLPLMIPGRCAECIAHLEATMKRHAKERSWAYVTVTDTVEAFRRRAPDDPVPAALPPAKLDSFVAMLGAEHAALGGPTAGKLDHALFAPAAFGFGIEAAEAGVGPEVLAGFAAKDLANQPAYDGIVKSRRTVHGAAMLDAELVIYGNAEAFAMFTQLVVMENGVPQVRAWSWSHSVDDADATAAARAKKLPVPAKITDAHGDAELEAVARAAFASREAYVQTLSVRDDAFSFGNSTGDEWEGPQVKAAFQAMGGAFSLRDGLHVEKVTEDVGFAAANINYKAGGTTKTFRVLAVFAKEPGGWKILQAHWSYGLPVPNPN